jgi:putative ABC transport system permease protein
VRRPRLGSVIFGEAGVALALALFLVAALTSFVAAAGPREQAASTDGAIRTAISQLAPGQKVIVTTATWFADTGGPNASLTEADQTAFGSTFGHNLAGIDVPPGSARAFVSGPLVQVAPHGIARAAIISKPPQLQLSTDSGLAGDSRLIAGAWPGPPSRGIAGRSAADRDAVLLPVVLTRATASTFTLRPGALIQLGAINGRLMVLKVTGIVQPRPGAVFWTSGAVQAAPATEANSEGAWYLGGAIASQQSLVALQSLWPDQSAFGDWEYPVGLAGLTEAGLGRLASAISAVTASTAATQTAASINFSFEPTPAATSQLPAALVTIGQQVTGASGIDALLFGGLFAACLLLMLLCGGLAADRYGPELALRRARGASVTQTALRTLRRALLVTGPGIVLGIGLAELVGAPAAGISGWALPALNAIIAVGAVPVRCVWRVRRAASPAGRAPEARAGRGPRRAVAEATVLIVAAAAIVALRVRGISSGSDQLAVAAPALVAIVASIVIGRLYPLPVRALLPLAGRRRGPVGFLGLSQAGRSGLAVILPALALVLTLTLAAFGVMLTQSAAAAELASSWVRTGADAIFTAPGNDVISVPAQRSVAAVPGVRQTALAYIEINTYQSNNFLLTTSARTESLGVAIVNPRPYAALARDTPWPQFPAAALARRAGPIPILVSAAAAGSEPGLTLGARQTLDAYGIKIGVRVAGIVGNATPAFPAGAAFIVYPQWAAARMPAVPGPNELLVTGASLSVPRLEAVASVHLHDDGLLLRSSLLRAQQRSAAQYAVRMFDVGSWAAAALSAVALLFGLGATAQARRHLRTRMSALGMSSRQARALALFDPVSLLIVAIAGMAAAGTLLALISSEVVPLRSLTGSAGPVAVQLNLTALAYPAAGVVALALIIIAAEHGLAARAESAADLRNEEAN